MSLGFPSSPSPDSTVPAGRLGWKWAVGGVAAAFGLVVFYFSVAGLDPMRTSFPDLAPEPDATEYLAAALALHEGRSYRIQLAGEFHPPRYPFG